MPKVMKALKEFRVLGGDPVWKLALDCNHVVVVPRQDGFPAPAVASCSTCPRPEPVGRDLRQKQVARWCQAAFGTTHTMSVEQRAIRLLEEAIEAYQAAGGKLGMAYQLVDYVFERPKGELGQELGGVGVTLLALANAAGLSADEEEAREVARVLALDLDVVRKRNATKDAAGFTVPRGGE